jgi:hypothetical protein
MSEVSRAAKLIRQAKRSMMAAVKSLATIDGKGDLSPWLRPALTVIGLTDHLLLHLEQREQEPARSAATSAKSKGPKIRHRNRIAAQVAEASNGSGLEAELAGADGQR